MRKMSIEMAKIYNTVLDRYELLWQALRRLFEDLTKRKIQLGVNVVHNLRNCRSMINFTRSHVCPGCDLDTFDSEHLKLQETLKNIKRDLVLAAQIVGKEYLNTWTSMIDKAERGEAS